MVLYPCIRSWGMFHRLILSFKFSAYFFSRLLNFLNEVKEARFWFTFANFRLFGELSFCIFQQSKFLLSLYNLLIFWNAICMWWFVGISSKANMWTTKTIFWHNLNDSGSHWLPSGCHRVFWWFQHLMDWTNIAKGGQSNLLPMRWQPLSRSSKSTGDGKVTDRRLLQWRSASPFLLQVLQNLVES
jgi:hypothetical protein